jgi:hypothetical protein
MRLIVESQSIDGSCVYTFRRTKLWERFFEVIGLWP